jgi:hypothetical protein
MENPGWWAALDVGAIEVTHIALVKMCLTAALDEGVTRGWTGGEERGHHLGNGKGQEELAIRRNELMGCLGDHGWSVWSRGGPMDRRGHGFGHTRTRVRA